MIMEGIQYNFSGKVAWRSPSNIALVKYWGKKQGQIPSNPSLSMTLEKAFTEMVIEFGNKQNLSEVIDLEFLFEGEKNPGFEQKIYAFLSSLLPEFPVLGNAKLKIHSWNTFPHSAGIASSASSMSALGLCLVSLFERAGSKFYSNSSFYQEASRISRLASGSACRSVYGGYAIWGKHTEVPGSSDEFAIPLLFEVHRSFKDIHDAILLVSSKEKSVSSRAGHSLMNGHPFAGSRYEMANNNISSMIKALTSGDFDEFVRITESEALTLHALMMSSNPSFILMEPDTINIVSAIRRFRHDTSIPVCFTLDAGPNIHLLYPGKDEKKVKEWIGSELLIYCQDSKWIDDRIGKGPVKIEN